MKQHILNNKIYLSYAGIRTSDLRFCGSLLDHGGRRLSLKTYFNKNDKSCTIYLKEIFFFFKLTIKRNLQNLHPNYKEFGSQGKTQKSPFKI